MALILTKIDLTFVKILFKNIDCRKKSNFSVKTELNLIMESYMIKF